ncbi:MAG TPA: TetR/AcrR family transcriptional regulator [Candidatus Methylacidiphilales bacterium]|nr:TetR/AcrR family transcriptional regulator [Candidatus Methylacidiphilales bacterium]
MQKTLAFDRLVNYIVGVKQESETKIKLLKVAVEMIWESSYGSVSVEDICERAGVKKGSFYYAFKSKSDLAIAAFEYYWDGKRVYLDQIFSVQVPPLQRLEMFCNRIINDQLEKYKTFGKLLGCPFCSLGCELSTQDENIRRKVEELSGRSIRYLEPAIRELMENGQIPLGDPKETSQEIYSYVTGVLLRAKIENNPKIVESLWKGVSRLLNIRVTESAAA